MEKPDLTTVSAEIRAYIEYLEAQLDQTEATARDSSRAAAPEPTEPPTTQQVISISRDGVAKRTPRHFYSRQRRGGMGVFDLDVSAPDHPALLCVADVEAMLLLFTNLGRAYRYPVANIEETAVRGKGRSLAQALNFQDNERLIAALPAEGGVYVVLVSERGWVQRVRSSYFGKSLFPGMSFHDPKQGGFVTAACWTRGDEELFIGTRQGKALRFRETQVPARNGCLGVRLDEGDVTVGITAVTEQSGVWLMSSDGKGSIRQMSGFRLNKAPGAGSKVALKTDQMIGVLTVQEADDLFIISETGKIIRFPAEEIPPKEGIVQGVNCMSLRNDAATAVGKSTP